MLKNNSTDCYIEGQCEDHVWLKHMTFVVNAERKCGSKTLHFWQSMQNESANVERQIFGSKGRAEAELQIFGSQGRVVVQKRNIRSLAVKAEQKCGSGISDL